MADTKQVLIMVPKNEWDQVRNSINEILELQSKREPNPMSGYLSKKQIIQMFGFSDRTWSRLKSSGLINVKKLGGLQFVKADDLIQAIESNGQIIRK